MAKEKATADNIASASDNEGLEHSVGGSTTRDDQLDAGVPMQAGSPDERQGPEDALGIGPKRGDYTSRIGPSDYQPHQSVPIEDPEDGGAQWRLEAQRPRAENIGDAEGKGGVDTE